MGLSFRKRLQLGPVGLNFTRRGFSSASVRAGRASFNARRGWTVRLPFGLTWRGRR